MEDLFKNLDLPKLVVAICPGAMIAIGRSFALKGSFPSLSKDDLGSIILGASAFYVLLLVFGIDINHHDFVFNENKKVLFFLILVSPFIVGFAIGMFEASDKVGKLVRRLGIVMPSPHATAWETMFHEIATWDMIVLYRKEGDPITGRWAPGSSASLDMEHVDIYLSEYGFLDENGVYSPISPRRGIYIRVDDLGAIETIDCSKPEEDQRLWMRTIKE